MMDIDESEFAVTSSPDKLARITELVSEAFEYDIKVVEIERELERVKSLRKDLLEKQIPELMASAQISVVSVPNTDIVCEIKPYVHASISSEWPKEQREAAFKWLEDNDHGDIIKNTLMLEFNRENAEEARQIYQRVKQMVAEYPKLQATPVLDKKVHHMTLSGFVREQIKEGADLPLAVLGATVGEVAKFKENKNGKKGKRG